MKHIQGLSRPVRLAGLVLIGIAIITGAIGVVTAATGGTDETAAPSTSAGPAPGSVPSPDTPGSGNVPPPSAQPGQSPAAKPPANPPAGGAKDGQHGQTDAKWVPVRVYNNSTIKGLAARAANDFRSGGWNVAETGNYPYGIIPTTTAYYTPGTDEETAAKALAVRFGMRTEPRFEGIQDSTPGVIVIVTNDYRGLHGGKG